MSELLGINFNKEIRAKFTLRGFMNRSEKNPDGWGIAFYPESEKAAQVIKEPIRAIESDMAEFVKRYNQISSKTFIAHVRHGSYNKCYANTHPFLREFNGQEYAFAHNGVLGKNYRSELTTGKYKPFGDTDSEFAFCHTMNFIESHGSNWTEESFLRLQEVMRKINSYGSFNCMMSDGQHLFCYRSINAGTGLCYTKRQPPYMEVRLLGQDLEFDLNLENGDDEEGYIIATEPLTNENWISLVPGNLYVFSSGEILFKDRGDFNEIYAEKLLTALRAIRREDHAVMVSAIAEATSLQFPYILGLIDYMVGLGYIIQHSEGSIDKHNDSARYFTVREKRDEIDRILLEEED